MEFINYDLAKKLKEKGFNEKCLFAYNDEQVINPKVVKEYGNLSDDGYYELTEDGGGKLKWDDVYIYEQQIILRDKIIIKRNFIDAPTISQVLKWLSEKKKIHLVVDIEPNGYFFIVNYNITIDFDGKYQFDIYNSLSCYYDDKQASIAGIEYVIDNLI